VGKCDKVWGEIGKKGEKLRYSVRKFLAEVREAGLELEVVVERGESLVPTLFKEDTTKIDQVSQSSTTLITVY
jgi:hypothetical protein